MKQSTSRTDFGSRMGALCLALAVIVTPAAFAQDDPADAPQDAESKRQARIEAYLQKKEQKRLEKEQRKAEKEATAAAEAEAQAQAKAAAEAAEIEQQQIEEAAHLEREQEESTAKALQAADGANPDLPKALRNAQESVRQSKLGADATVQGYLDLVDRQEASPYQLAAMGNFLAAAGMRAEAKVYYEVALTLESNDPLLWMNFGTLNRQNGDPKAAANAYSKALSIDRNYAAAHYNLGAAYDELSKYNEAVEEYKIALTLDPALGDPTKNPQAVNNDRLMTVRMLLYRESAGSAGLPLEAVPAGDLPDGPAGND